MGNNLSAQQIPPTAGKHTNICAPGHVIKDFQARTGSHVDAVKFGCTDGQETQWMGGGGGYFRQVTSPTGFTGLGGNASTQVDSILIWKGDERIPVGADYNGGREYDCEGTNRLNGLDIYHDGNRVYKIHASCGPFTKIEEAILDDIAGANGDEVSGTVEDAEAAKAAAEAAAAEEAARLERIQEEERRQKEEQEKLAAELEEIKQARAEAQRRQDEAEEKRLAAEQARVEEEQRLAKEESESANTQFYIILFMMVFFIFIILLGFIFLMRSGPPPADSS